MLHTRPLSLNKDFRRVYARARSRVHPLLVTYAIRNGLPFCRLGITASKKVGNAVQRNRARRIVREAYRLYEPAVSPGWDFVFVIRKAMIQQNSKTQDAAKVLERHIKELCTKKK